MKKIFVLMIVLVSTVISSCTCNRTKEVKEVEVDAVLDATPDSLVTTVDSTTVTVLGE